MADLISWKIVLTIVLLILGLASVLAPKYCCKNKPYWFSVGNMFSAGVLLSAALVHSLSDANSTIFYESSTIPYANMICGFSFLVMLLIEEVGHSAHESNETNISRKAGSETETQEPALHNTDDGEENHHGHSHCSITGNHYGSIEVPILSSRDSPRRPHHHPKHLEEHLRSSTKSVVTLLFALVVHSVVLGVSIGVSAQFSGFFELSIAVLSHKLFAGFALGTTIKAANFENAKSLLSAAVPFACSTPIGILIGMNIKLSDDTSLFSGTVKAIVAGLFLYIAIIEICMKELLICRAKAKIVGIGSETAKLSGIMLGFTCMSILAFYV